MMVFFPKGALILKRSIGTEKSKLRCTGFPSRFHPRTLISYFLLKVFTIFLALGSFGMELDLISVISGNLIRPLLSVVMNLSLFL